MAQTSYSESMTEAIAGQFADSSIVKDVSQYINEEASASVPFGVMVGQGTALDGFLKLAATTDDMIGIVLHSHAYAKDTELDSTGLKPGARANIVRRGLVWVYVEEAVTEASNVLVRCVATGNEKAGAFRDTADGSDCADVSAFCRFMSRTTGAGLAKLWIDTLMRSA